MGKEHIGIQILQAFPGLNRLEFFEWLDEWREGLQTRFVRSGSEDSELGGYTDSVYAGGIVRNGIFEPVDIKDSDIGGGILISNSTHFKSHMSGDTSNFGITLQELLTRYDSVSHVVIVHDSRDTSRRNWDETYIEVVRIPEKS